MARARQLLGLERQQHAARICRRAASVDELQRAWRPAATEIAAEVLARLHTPSDSPLPSDCSRCGNVSAACSARPRPTATSARQPLRRGGAVAERLLANPREFAAAWRPASREHHVRAARLAGDRPEGLLGDPGFDAANLFYNPLDRDDLASILSASPMAATSPGVGQRDPFSTTLRLWHACRRMAREGAADAVITTEDIEKPRTPACAQHSHLAR